MDVRHYDAKTWTLIGSSFDQEPLVQRNTLFIPELFRSRAAPNTVCLPVK
jgi:hypothetical protein